MHAPLGATMHAHPPRATTHAPQEQPRMPSGATTHAPPVNRMTNRCKNITLPQTSFAGGNNLLVFFLKIFVGPLLFLFLTSGDICPEFQNPGELMLLNVLLPVRHGYLGNN